MAWTVDRFRDFTGGENLKILPEYIKPNQVVSALNCIITSEGLLETRFGKIKVNTTTLGEGQITSIHRYSEEDGTRWLVVQHGTALYAKEWDGVTPFASFGAAIKTGLDEAKLRGTVWKGKLYLTNGIDQAFSFDGTACVDVAAIPKCDKLYLYAGRFWCVDKATGFLENSNLEDPTNWSETGSYKVRDGEGDTITALSPQNGGMVIFKENSAQTLYGTNPAATGNIQIAEPFSRDIGCVAIDSVLDHGLVMGKNNLYTFGLNSMEELPPTHTPLLDQLTLAQKAGIFAVAHPLEKRALVFVPGSEQKALCIDAKWGGAITTWDTMNAACFCVAGDKGDTGALLIGDQDNGFVYMYGGNLDGTLVIQTRIKSAYIDGGSTRQKEWGSYIPEIEPLETDTVYRFYYNYDVDYSAYGGAMSASYANELLRWGVDHWNEANWGDSFRVNEAMFPPDARGNRVSFEIVCNNRMRFNGFTTRYRLVGAQI
jgi:hypothetical protein